MSRAPRPRGTSQRGAIILEAAIIVPLLVLLAFGLAEFGLAWRTANTTAKATRAGAIQASRAIDIRTADLDTLTRTRSTLGSARDDVAWVMVYRTNALDGSPSAACSAVADSITTGSSGVSDWCNVYAGPSLADFDSTDFTDPGCVGDPDEWLCPIGRRDLFGPNDRIGVQIQVDHEWLSHVMPGGSRTITDRSVLPLELDLATAGGAW